MPQLTDGRGLTIDLAEFRVFVEQAERQLLILFRSIDTDQSGKLDQRELQEAFRRAGLKVPNSRLETFFADIDMNNDGFISFDEWRYVSLALCSLVVDPPYLSAHMRCVRSLRVAAVWWRVGVVSLI